ncbi:MAG: hypothetical protein L7S63_10295 [Flavobacteriales bacterium]|nr:hypothetical protein [Flavobacteriales bacterium]
MFIHLPFVYYPGAGHDFEVLTHFTQQHGSTNFVFTDYDPDMAQPAAITEKLKAWTVVHQEKITPMYFGARRWKDFWFDDPNAHTFNTPDQAFGTKLTLKQEQKENITLHYLCSDGVGTLALAAKTMGTPDVIVIQDHGMGGNWDQFGGPSRLYETAQTHGCPPYVFLAENTEGWPGYSVPERADFDGQFGSAGNKRALCAIL